MATILDLSRAISAGRLSPVKLTEEYLARIERLDGRINSYITVLREESLRSAEAAEAELREGRVRGPLHGIPVSVKDLIYINGVRCTAGSKILSNHVAGYDSPVVRRLKQSGAVIIGTTNMHEFACGATSVNPHFGPVRNPWNTERIAGGSSGGSAASVAADLAIASIGTDTSGSVRIPASLCGVVGLKPTYGLISRIGVIPLAASFDTVGTLTMSAWDAAAMLSILAGHEQNDMTTADVEIPDYIVEINNARNFRVGVPRNYFMDVVDAGVEESFNRFTEKLTSLGFEVKPVEFKDMDRAVESWAAIRRAEATAFHERWLEEMPDQYGEDVRMSLELGRQIPATRYINAQNGRPALRESFLDSMREVDLVATPTTPITAPVIGQSKVSVKSTEVDVYSALVRLTLPFNVVGFPALSIPIGLFDGLPVGAQLVGRPFEESALLQLAHAYEGRFGQFEKPKLD